MREKRPVLTRAKRPVLRRSTRPPLTRAGDVLLRRTLLGLESCQGLDCLDEIADRMGRILGWDEARRREEIARYRAEIEPMRRFSTV